MLYYYVEDPVGTITAHTDEEPVKPGLRELCGYIMHVDENGYATPIMAEIRDVKVVKDKVVIVSFVDGTQEKAVCAEEDTFSVENGITICLIKKLLKDNCLDSGSSIYNNLIRYAMKKIGADKRKEEEERNRIKAKKAERKRAHDEASRQKNRDRQYWIDIYADAMKKALSDVAAANPNQTSGIDPNQISLFIDDGK